MVKVAYITSGKIGIHRFTYNELVELEKNNIKFVLCLTQLKSGPWMPKGKWKIFVASRKKSIMEFVKLLLVRTKLITELFSEAKKKHVVPYFFIALSLHSDLKEKEITSLHCQMGDKKLYIGYFLKKLMKTPLTVTVHAHGLYQREVYDNNKYIRDLYSNCDKVITISNFNSNIIQKKFGVENKNLQVMRLFPDIDYQNYVKEKTKILVVANWAEKKGYKILLEAVKSIKRNDFVVWAVGGSYFSDNSIELEKLVKEYQVTDRISILGRQGGTVLDIIFSACDIFCLPSYTEYYEDDKPAEREGIPVALMEAMAWGKPVISTKHAGIPELVEEILIEERNVEELRNAIEYLLENPEKWSAMGKRNQEIIKQKYSKKNVSILVNIFRTFSK